MSDVLEPLSQHQHFHLASRNLAERDLVFLQMMKTTPITRWEFAQLRKKHPRVWSRYDVFFGRGK
jgi:hypothetical protein